MSDTSSEISGEEILHRDLRLGAPVSNWALGNRIARLFEKRWIQGYVRWKIRLDPVYAEIARRLEGTDRPVLDIGCGVGVLSFYLRESGFDVPITGLDRDREKLEYGKEVASKHYEDLHFKCERVEEIAEIPGDVVILDVIHYLDRETRSKLLGSIAERMRPGSRLLMRTPLREGGWRDRVSSFAERAAGVIGWNRMKGLDSPTRVEIDSFFPAEQFAGTTAPLWGWTPFNGVLLEYKRRN